MTSVVKARTVLLGVNEPDQRGYLETSLKSLGYVVVAVDSADDLLKFVRDRYSSADAVLMDPILSSSDGRDVLTEIRRRDPGLPVIAVSADCQTSESIMQAVKCGENGFLSKPVEQELLKQALDKAINNARHGRNSQGVRIPSDTYGFVARADRMRQIQALIGRIGSSEEPVLIQGETGSGKEVLARELHTQSPRASKPFLKLNCAALPSELVESELFGYEKGAFTGAFQRKPGMFEMANGGTILLDEIGDMDVKLQAKLLQVLQDQEFHRIGAVETIRVDVRVIAATHRDLEKAVTERSFREDLYYRLNVITVEVPPLRERQEDILPLAEFLWKKHAGAGPLRMTASLKHVFSTYQWPGNVRELENTVRKLIVLEDTEMIATDLLARAARRQGGTTLNCAPTANPQPDPQLSPGPTILEDVRKAKQQAEVEAILAVLNATRWNRKQAAALLKVDYKALLYKMKKLGIDDKVVAIGPHKSDNERSLAATGTD